MIFNDYTALHLSRLDPEIGELLRFADSMLRPDGAAWQPQNRAMVLRRDGEVHDGRLSLEFCRRIYQWMVDFQRRWDYPLLSDWQKQVIQAIWLWRESLPEVQVDVMGQIPLFESPLPTPVAAVRL